MKEKCARSWRSKLKLDFREQGDDKLVAGPAVGVVGGTGDPKRRLGLDKKRIIIIHIYPALSSPDP